ncbi:hypothetical protein [Nocardioides ferulae]|uniref:hypothetical protein n=1 Tax=Nocardioides ferulae TaxID=2340821 RepID=UPI000EB54C0E|nr:hypothetical protein [Nocardioides ferulae]
MTTTLTTAPGRRARSTQRRTPRRGVAAIALAALSVGLLAGCGQGDEEEGNGRSDVEVAVNPTADASGLPVAERRFFSDDSPWNVRIDGARVDPRSDRMIDLATMRIGIVERPGQSAPVVQQRRIEEGLYINTERWTTPVVVGGEPTEVVCRQLQCGDGDDTVVLNVPTDVDPDPRYDGWFTIFDTSQDVAFDLWRARREADGSISYHFMRRWELDGPGYSPPQVVGARGSGLPLFAGLIRPGELEAGEINHALAISLPGPAQNYFVQPASSTDGNGATASVPEGARIRLRQDAVIDKPVDPITGKPVKLTRQQQRYADAIVAALRTYGAIVVDRARVPTLYAQRDVTAPMLGGNELQGLHIDDFEVITLGQRYKYPPEEVGDDGLVEGRLNDRERAAS